MEKIITDEQFFLSIADYERILEKEYLAQLEKAEDKEYAARYYQNTLFLQNEMVPYPTVIFHELEYTFQHHAKLVGIRNAYQATMNLMEGIRSVAIESVKNGKRYLAGDPQIKLHDCYVFQIENNFRSLSELVTMEDQILQLTNENLSGALCIHLAGQRLRKKYNDDSDERSDKEEKSNGQYTLNERTLALYVLMESLGFKQGLNEDRTTLAALYHLVIDKNFNDTTKIKNSNIYKALGSAPAVVKDPVKLNHYLRNIRPFFENANMENALKIIDDLIKTIDS